VSDVSGRISQDVEEKGRLQAAAARCAANLQGHPNPVVALMLAWLDGYATHQQDQLRGVQRDVEAAEEVGRHERTMGRRRGDVKP
jgi:hypothetical protein